MRWASSTTGTRVTARRQEGGQREREKVMVQLATQEKTTYAADSAPLSERSDEDLVLEYMTNRDPILFTELVVRHERELYGYLHRFLGQVELARDVLQATFLQLHLKCDSFHAGRRLRPWLYAIATNQAIDALRSNSRHWGPSIDASLPSPAGEYAPLSECLEGWESEPPAEAELRECRAGVRQAVDQLPMQLRQLVRMVYFDGLKYREAADALAIPLGTVKSRMHSAFHRLQRELHHLAS
jgi:RNA polymerase sigma-70 factor (ECF subfamily)